MNTFRDLIGHNPTKPLIAYSCFGGGGGGSSSNDDNDSSSSMTNQDKINEIYASSDDPWSTNGAELNALLEDGRDNDFNPAPVSSTANNVSSNDNSSGGGSNTTRMDIANSITKDDGTTYKDGKLYNDNDGTLVTENTSYQNLADFLTPSDGTTYNDGQLVDGNDNTLRMDIANSLTEDDGMQYTNGILYNSDGTQVTENTPYQDLTNAITFTDNKTYEDGQLVVNDTPPPPPPPQVETDNDPGTVAVAQDTTVIPPPQTPEVDPPRPPDIDEDEVDYDLGETLTSLTPAATDTTNVTNVTSLPDDYLTEEDLARYLENLDLGSNAYDPAAFLNAYGFALNGITDDLIASTNPSNGLYTRRAVRDRDTGEIRYVNVPIGAGAISGNDGVSQFRLDRRNGFASMV